MVIELNELTSGHACVGVEFVNDRDVSCRVVPSCSRIKRFGVDIGCLLCAGCLLKFQFWRPKSFFEPANLYVMRTPKVSHSRVAPGFTYSYHRLIILVKRNDNGLILFMVFGIPQQ